MELKLVEDEGFEPVELLRVRVRLQSGRELGAGLVTSVDFDDNEDVLWINQFGGDRIMIPVYRNIEYVEITEDTEE